MNSISNHFAITAIQEGVTIQGSLRISGSLSQNYNVASDKCIPDWKNSPNKRPVVYPVIRKGISYMGSSQLVNTTWLYNDVPITFDDDNLSSNFVDGENNPLFEIGDMAINLGGSNYNVPFIRIIANLASANNVDLDTIGFTGSVEVFGKQSTFAAQVDVRIAQMTTQGYLGLLSPESAIISEKGQSVTIEAALFDSDGSAISTFYNKWFDVGTGNEVFTARNSKSLTVNEEDVTDNGIVRCDFFTDAAFANRVTSAFASIDDTQDPEYLYISFDGSDSDKSGQLRNGESCVVSAWVATQENPAAINAGYSSFNCTFYDGAENEITNAQGTPTMLTKNNKGSVTIPYDFVANNGYKIIGIVSAS